MLPAKLNVAVIGTGRAGFIHARNFRSAVSSARLAAVVEPDPTRRREVLDELELETGYAAWEEAISDVRIDAVVVAAPTHLHSEIVVAAAEAGKHVLCEKPLGLHASECRTMLEAVGKHGVVLQLGFMRRYDASFMAARARLEAGEIGDVVLVKSLTHGPSVPQPWMYDIARSNGPLAEVSSHDIDAVRWMTGSEFEEVYALAGNFRCPEARERYPDFYDNVVLTARMTGGRQGLVEGAMAVRYGYDSRMEILGTRGVLFIGSLKADTVMGFSDRLGASGRIVASWRQLFAAAYLEEDTDFVRCIREGRPPRAGGIDGLRAVEVVAAGHRSLQTRRPVQLGEAAT